MTDFPSCPPEWKLLNGATWKLRKLKTVCRWLLTAQERHSKIIEVWTKTKDEVVKLTRGTLDTAGSVSTIVESGARGSLAS